MAQIYFPWMYVASNDAGKPIALGSMYFGQPDLDPVFPANQIQVRVKQEDGTLLNVAQPILLNAGGVPTYNGSPVILDIVEDEFSLKVLNALGGQEYYNENNIPLQFGTNQIEDGAVTTPKLADLSVTEPKLADQAVTGVKLNDDVAGAGLSKDGSGNLQVNGSVTIEVAGDNVRVVDQSIGGTEGNDKITLASIGQGNMANNSIGNDQMLNESIGQAEMIDPTAANTSLIAQLSGTANPISTTNSSYPAASAVFVMGVEDSQRRLGCRVLIGGDVRIKLDHDALGVNCRVRLRKNGVQQQEFITNSGTSQSYNFDVSVNSGDHLEISHRTEGIGTSELRDVRVTSGTNTPAIA